MTRHTQITFRRFVAGLAAIAALTIGVGVAASSASPDESTEMMQTITRIDAEARARDAVSDTLPVFDQKVGDIVDVAKSDLEAEQRRAAKDPGYLDAEGNPRYVLVWSGGKLIPGPALDCKPNPERGEPDICTVQD